MENVNLRAFSTSDNFRIEQCERDFPEKVIESHKKLQKTLTIEISIEDIKGLRKIIDSISSIFSAIGIYFIISTKNCIKDRECRKVMVTIGLTGTALYLLPGSIILLGRIIGTLITHHTVEYTAKQAAEYVLKGFWQEGFGHISNFFAILSTFGIVTYINLRCCKNIHMIPFKKHEYGQYLKICQLFDYKAFKEAHQRLQGDNTISALVRENFAVSRNNILHMELKLNPTEENRLAEDPEIGDETEYFDFANIEYIIFPMIQDIGAAFYALKEAGAKEEDPARKELLETKADELHKQFKGRIDLVRYEKVILMDHYNLHANKNKVRTPYTRILDPRKIEAFIYDWNFHNEGFKKLQEKNICPAFRATILKYKIAIMKTDPLAKKYVRVIEIDEDGNEVVILDNPPQENMEPIDFKLDISKNLKENPVEILENGKVEKID